MLPFLVHPAFIVQIILSLLVLGFGQCEVLGCQSLLTQNAYSPKVEMNTLNVFPGRE